MEILEDRALILRTRNPHKYSIIPKSKAMPRADGGYDVAVYWGLDEARVLRNLGVKDVPSPIIRRYDWPGRYTPMAHQIETSAFLTMYRRAFVFSEPGTGKTLSALWAADYLMKLGKVRRVLVLCPLSIMHSAWMGDLNNSIIHRSAVIAHHAQASRRIEMIQRDYEIVITNYEGLIEQNQNSCQGIAQNIFQGKPQSKSAQTQPCHQRRDVDANRTQSRYDAHHQYTDIDGMTRQVE